MPTNHTGYKRFSDYSSMQMQKHLQMHMHMHMLTHRFIDACSCFFVAGSTFLSDHATGHFPHFPNLFIVSHAQVRPDRIAEVKPFKSD